MVCLSSEVILKKTKEVSCNFYFRGGSGKSETYLASLTEQERAGLYSRYRLDFLLFGYEP
jgi:hypothetical protein